MLPALPAQAGMGTGNPPPPPPPPRDVEARLFEGSADSTINGNGYPNITVFHRRSSWDGSTSCVTRANGAIRYTIRQGDAIEHRSRMFGISSSQGAGDISVATDSFITLKIAGDEKDVTDLANPSAESAVTRWKVTYEFDRGAAATVALGGSQNDFPFEYSSRKFISRITMARHKGAPASEGAPGQSLWSTFKLKALEGYDATNALRLKWMDDPANGTLKLAPGAAGTLTLHKVLSTSQK
jgi:hypothetical protein